MVCLEDRALPGDVLHWEKVPEKFLILPGLGEGPGNCTWDV